jgi:acetyl esterase/lipase
MENFEETELTCRGDLEALLYRPKVADSQAVPLFVDVHGGAWSFGHRKRGRHYCRALAAKGIASLAIEFRQGPDHKHPAAAEDIIQALQVANSLEIDIESLGIVGHSSGGHLALLAALCPHQFTNEQPVPSPDFVIALWPVSNPIARYQYVRSRSDEDPGTWAKGFDPHLLAEGHRGYFPDEQSMHDAAIQRILMANEHSHLPRTFIVQPELDENVPVFMSQTLHGALLAAGCDVSYKVYPGVGHSFAQADGPQTQACIDDMARFIANGLRPEHNRKPSVRT